MATAAKYMSHTDLSSRREQRRSIVEYGKNEDLIKYRKVGNAKVRKHQIASSMDTRSRPAVSRMSSIQNNIRFRLIIALYGLVFTQ